MEEGGIVAAKTSKKKERQRELHVVSSGKSRNRPAAGLTQSPTRPKPSEATGPKLKSKPKPTPTTTAKTPSKADKPKGEGEKFVAKRKSDKAARDKARAKKAQGLTAQDIKNDKTLSATEKKRILKILEKSKGIGEG
jgi:hypothetical protein